MARRLLCPIDLFVLGVLLPTFHGERRNALWESLVTSHNLRRITGPIRISEYHWPDGCGRWPKILWGHWSNALVGLAGRTLIQHQLRRDLTSLLSLGLYNQQPNAAPPLSLPYLLPLHTPPPPPPFSLHPTYPFIMFHTQPVKWEVVDSYSVEPIRIYVEDEGKLSASSRVV
ncbi:hypothetical protein FRC14_006047 [Serendipita sp. 396]|nr:hypothetical protein FRC14_006047 [Serendipita sp. 396]